jgi:hypothetical protein
MKTFTQFIVEKFITKKTSIKNLKVWHGSNATFDKFEQSKSRIVNDFFGGGVAYFTDNKEVAIQYAKGMSKKSGSPTIYECQISLSNYFDVDTIFSGETLVKFVNFVGAEQFARNAGLLKYGENAIRTIRKLKSGEIELNGEQVFKGMSATISTARARETLISFGYDGLRYNGGVNMQMQKKHDVYLPYDVSSIKMLGKQEV